MKKMSKNESRKESSSISRRSILGGIAAGVTSFAIVAPRSLASDFEPVTLTTHNWGPPRALTAGYEWWAERVTERTDGAVQFRHLYSAALVAGADQIDGIRGGAFEIAGIASGFAPGKTPLWTVDTLRAMGQTGDVGALGHAMAEIASLPELEQELANWNAKFLFYASSPADEWLGTKRVETVEDLAGIRLWTYGPGNTRMFANLGAVPSSMAHAELYEAIGRGTLDGAHFPIASGGSLGLPDIVTHITMLGTGATGWPIVINLDSWNNLDAEVQKIMLEEAEDVPERYSAVGQEGIDRWLPEFAERAEVIELSDDQKEQLREIGAMPTWDEWVDEHGDAGRTVLDALITAMEKHGA